MIIGKNQNNEAILKKKNKIGGISQLDTKTSEILQYGIDTRKDKQMTETK